MAARGGQQLGPRAACRPARCRHSASAWVASPPPACRAHAANLLEAPFEVTGHSRPDVRPALICPAPPAWHAFPEPTARACRSDAAAALSEPAALWVWAFAPALSADEVAQAAALSEPAASWAEAFAPELAASAPSLGWTRSLRRRRLRRVRRYRRRGRLGRLRSSRRLFLRFLWLAGWCGLSQQVALRGLRAGARTERRGQHTRQDCAGKEKGWRKPHAYCSANGRAK